jgi:hypothetical protein
MQAPEARSLAPQPFNIVDHIRAKRDIPQVALQNYMTLRSKTPNIVVCVFEGPEDYPYYDTIISRVNENFEYAPFIANGKDQVLGLRKILSERNGTPDAKVAFFIDHDFDGYKTYSPAGNTYCTDGYSIENNLCSTTILSKLLSVEYMCVKAGDTSRIDPIITKIEDRLQEFHSSMHEANLAIFIARKTGIKLRNIQNLITKYLTIKIESISKNNESHLELIGWPDHEDFSALQTHHSSDFAKLEPRKSWRGKFILSTYIELLHQIKEDRCSEKPELFDKKCKIKFNPKGDVIRTLALLSPIPSCLRSFVLHISIHHFGSGLETTENYAYEQQ